jgi:hypothetical protein
MSTADQYRVKAAEFSRMARGETNPRLQLEYAGMAELYFRLSLLAEKNQKNDLLYETPGTEGQQAAE